MRLKNLRATAYTDLNLCAGDDSRTVLATTKPRGPKAIPLQPTPSRLFQKYGGLACSSELTALIPNATPDALYVPPSAYYCRD